MPNAGKLLGGALAVMAVGALMSSAEAAAAGAGTVSWVEGRVLLDGTAVGPGAPNVLAIEPGHVLRTEQGKAEVLLTPGVFVRLAENSSLKLINSSDSGTRVELLGGEALVEVLQMDKHARLDVIDRQGYTRLLDDGLYRFAATGPTVAVLEGKVRVEDDRRSAAFGKGKQLDLAGHGAMQPKKFDRDWKDDLYYWSDRRTRAAAHTSESMAENLLAFNPLPKYQAGWYWHPWYQSWAFIPEDGYRMSAFGYGFYAPTTMHSVAPVFADFRE